MRFQVTEKTAIPRYGVLFYRPKEYSFDVEPHSLSAWTTILLNDLNVELNDAGKAVSVWGLCPHTSWSEKPLILPNAVYGEIAVDCDIPLKKGVSVRISPRGAYLPVFVDWDKGCVKIEGDLEPIVAVTIIPGVTVELARDGQLSSLWLLPQHGLERNTVADRVKLGIAR